jgi:hypothetical protein
VFIPKSLQFRFLNREVPGQPANISDMVLLLASDETRYVTGSEMLVHGGIFILVNLTRPLFTRNSPSVWSMPVEKVWKQDIHRPATIQFLGLSLALALGLAGCSQNNDTGLKESSPLDNLPTWITPLLETGVRPDWSPQGDHLVYLDSLVGNVFELDLDSGKSRNLTGHFAHRGFTRARYLSNGDLLLCGPAVDAGIDSESERWRTELWFLSRSGLRPAQRLGHSCFEGPATSRQSMQIVWTESDYPARLIFGRSEIWGGRIEVSSGTANVVDKRLLVSRRDFNYLAFLETQDFRPPQDEELIFTAYAYKGGEVMGVNLRTGAITNYSQNWAYDEAEGVFPDGDSIAVEREINTYSAIPVGDIDIWQLALDGTARTRRLTYFSKHPGYGANNPVISPDGKKMAFGLRIKGGQHGNAQGMLIYDFSKSPETSWQIN